MVKQIFVFRRNPDLSLAEFSAYWRETHPPLALAVPGLRRYVQSHRVDEGMGDEPSDGFASLWYADEAAVARALASREWAIAVADGDNFLDPASVGAFYAREMIMRDLPVTEEMVKLAFFFNRKPGMTPQEFRRHWLDVHGPLAMANISRLRRYVQNHASDADYADGEPAFDGLVEAWFDDLEALAATAASDEHELVRRDEPNFVDVSRVTYLPVREHVVR